MIPTTTRHPGSVFCTLFSVCACAAIVLTSTATGAVFDEAAGAGPTQAYYGNWGTNANAANPAPHSYNNYRKTDAVACPSPANCDLPVAFADETDPTGATWTNMSHPGNPLKSPGMFIGQSPSTTSYPDNVLYLGGIFDLEGAGSNGDTIMRTEWDFRVGFLEEPDEFVGVRQPNDESWDLWSGAQHNAAGWGTDGVSLQLVTGATDNDDLSPIGTEQQYVRANAVGIVLQAGGPPAPSLAHEGNREGFPNGLQTNAITGFSPDGEISPINTNVSTGVDYGDQLEITWWMEQIEPTTDVTFFAQIGHTLYQQSFDPGSPDDPKIPNPNTDPTNAFTDGFFDWRNATPVVFIGAIGGTVGATGLMGFNTPNTNPSCDFDMSGTCDLADLNELLYMGLVSGDAQYDLDGSGTVDLGDRDAFLRAVGSLPGDADLSGVDNAADLNALGSNWQSAVSSWSDGDFNGDGQANASDLNDLGIWWTKTAADFANAAAPVGAAVPEPAGGVALLGALIGLFAARRNCRV